MKSNEKKTAHIHAKYIHAFADGYEIEELDITSLKDGWKINKCPKWNKNNKYRIYDPHKADKGETSLYNEYIVQVIQNAINEILELKLSEYMKKGRKEKNVFARMIFAKLCSMYNIPAKEYINRDRTTIIYYLKNYPNEEKYNPYFREIACKIKKLVRDKLNNF